MGHTILAQLFFHRFANAPDQTDRLGGEEIQRLFLSDHKKPARLIIIRGDLSQKLIMAEPDGDGDANLISDAVLQIR